MNLSLFVHFYSLELFRQRFKHPGYVICRVSVTPLKSQRKRWTVQRRGPSVVAYCDCNRRSVTRAFGAFLGFANRTYPVCSILLAQRHDIKGNKVPNRSSPRISRQSTIYLLGYGKIGLSNWPYYASEGDYYLGEAFRTLLMTVSKRGRGWGLCNYLRPRDTEYEPIGSSIGHINVFGPLNSVRCPESGVNRMSNFGGSGFLRMIGRPQFKLHPSARAVFYGSNGLA